MNLTVVTPWWNQHWLAEGYWHAMTALRDTDRVIIVDNASKPAITAHDDHTVIRLRKNLGFSKACNRGLAEVETDAVLFLNSDIRMTSPDWPEQIRTLLRERTLVGAQLRTDGHASVDGRPMPYLDGWCVAGLTTDFRELGGWDESLEEPSYYGDNLLCAQAKAAGFRLVAQTVGLKHLGNHTSRLLDVTEVSARNRARYEQAVRELLAA